MIIAACGIDGYQYNNTDSYWFRNFIGNLGHNVALNVDTNCTVGNIAITNIDMPSLLPDPTITAKYLCCYMK